MELVLHTGAHFTEDDRLIKCLLRNRDDFAKRGIAVPRPATYRKLLRETLSALQNAPPARNARDILLDGILDKGPADRAILSHAHFFGVPQVALRHGFFYPKASERLQQLSRLFPDDQIEMFMAIRNPATFIPALFEKSPKEGMIGFLDGVDPLTIRWSDMLHHIREHVPNISITVWCNEDSPLIWAQIIRDMAGLEHGEKIIGGFDLLSAIMSREGMQRFRTYLKSHPVMTEIQKRRVIAAFLDKFALDEEIEEELDMPGWSEDLIDRLTEVYDEDVFEIQRIPGVQMITP